MKLSDNTNHSLVHHCNTLISTLLSQPYQTLPFKSRWITINTKLQLLPPHLSDISDFPNSSSNPLCSDLIFSISQTLTLTLALSERCRNPNPTSGKLQTQSDLDSIAMKLTQHLQDSDLLIKSGVLRMDSEPVSSKRESIRIEARNLITRLQIGNFDSKNVALDSLLSLIHEDDKNVLITVAQGIVPVLSQLLDSSFVELKEKAVSAVSRVSQIESCKHVLVADGVLGHLLRILESGGVNTTGFAKEKACLALQSLSFSNENGRIIGSRSGIAALLEICEMGTAGAQAVAAGVLRNLAGIPQIRSRFIEENAVPFLIGLLGSGTAAAQENAAGCLMNLVAEDGDSMKALVIREGGVQCLMNFWDGASTGKSQEVAVGFLRNLASCKPIGEILISSGFLPRSANALNWGGSGVRIAAASTVYELAWNAKNRKEIGEAGCIAPLIRMLEAKSVSEKEAAAQVLSSLLVFPGNRRIFRKEERGITAAVLLLNPSVQNLQKKYPISILLSLSQSAKCRKQMVAAGSCGYLPKLVEMEIEGAKKLLEILSRGKLWNVFR